MTVLTQIAHRRPRNTVLWFDLDHSCCSLAWLTTHWEERWLASMENRGEDPLGNAATLLASFDWEENAGLCFGGESTRIGCTVALKLLRLEKQAMS